MNVSLRWLKESDHEFAKVFRGAISGTPECVLCCMFLETEWTDENGVISKCEFDEIHISELDHFQQMADVYDLPVKIVSLDYLPNENDSKERVQFD